MGSGKLLKRAINKYGVDNFKKDILEVYDTEDKMNLAEKILVVVDSEISYNLCPGGHGGFGYINDGSEIHKNNCKKGRTIANRIILEKYGVYNPSKLNKNKTALSKRMKLLHAEGRIKIPARTGILHTKEHKEYMSNIMKDKQSGCKNSQFGTMWITNGVDNKKIKKDIDIIPEGWYKGRILKIIRRNII